MSLSKSSDEAIWKIDRKKTVCLSLTCKGKMSFTNHLSQITYQECSHCCLLMIVGNVNIDNVHWFIVYRWLGLHKIDNLKSNTENVCQSNKKCRRKWWRWMIKSYLVINTLFSSNNNVELLGAVLEFLRLLFDAPVSIKHVQKAILCVATTNT